MEHYGIQMAAGHLTVAAESKEPYAADVLAALHEDAALVVANDSQSENQNKSGRTTKSQRAPRGLLHFLCARCVFVVEGVVTRASKVA